MGQARIVIFSGGTLGDWALEDLRPDDVLVGADRGAWFLVSHGRRPRLSLGDFDSVSAGEKEAIRNGSEEFTDCDPLWKDLTDTEMAFQWALAQQPREIVLLGALGTRWDHSLANVQLLAKGLERGISCAIRDPHNEIRLIGKSLKLQAGKYSHVSLLPFSPIVSNVTLQGFRYPLQDATIRMGMSLGISNILEEPEGTVTVGSGLLLIIQSTD